jgi:hypothetical protein
VGDFNGDGKLDVVTGNDSSVSVLPGNGDRTFQAPRNYVATPLPLVAVRSVAAGDFNGDGKLDLAVALEDPNLNLGYVTVLLSKGNGSFRPAVDYSAGNGSYFVAVGDLNGDGKLDLVAADEQGRNVSVLLGNGNGTFQPAVQYPVGSFPSSIAVEDFNGDGKLDLAVANFRDKDVSVLLGNGNGTFQTAVNYTVETYPLSVTVGDFNGDGKLDLVTANEVSDTIAVPGNVSVLLGNGDGTFQAAVNYPVGPEPALAAVGDFNGDGKLDLAVAGIDVSSGFALVAILLGKGDGTFQAPVSYSVHCYPSAVAVADFNSDGKLDLAVGAPCGDGLGLSILLGNGDGTFQAAANYNSGPTSGNAIAVGDFNGDGAPDLALCWYGVTVLLNTRGTVASLASSANPSSLGQPVTFTAHVYPWVKGSARIAGNVTGTVTFRDGTTTLGKATLVSGRASFTTSSLNHGTHSITATYSGDSNYNSVTSQPRLIQTVQ